MAVTDVSVLYVCRGTAATVTARNVQIHAFRVLKEYCLHGGFAGYSWGSEQVLVKRVCWVNLIVCEHWPLVLQECSRGSCEHVLECVSHKPSMLFAV